MPETKVIMPQMGESVFEGTITKWLKQKGEHVNRDEPLFEISTDKVDSEIPSPASGVLSDILVPEGQTVEINTVVALIDGETAARAAPGPENGPGDARTPAAPPETPVRAESVHPGGAAAPISPVVGRLAAEHGINLAALEGKGTGAGGRITKRDILSLIEQRGEETRTPGKPRPATGVETERVPMTAMRKAIAEHMVVSRRTSAHVATVFEVDCTRIFQAREALKPDFERRGRKLTITPFFARAAVQALLEFPILNASVEGAEILLRKTINLGIAVALDDGLLVPVIRDAASRSLPELAETIGDLSERARAKKLSPDEVQDGTFTLTNPGGFGGLFGIPIINQPQVAILAVGGVQKRPLVVNDAIAIRPMAYLALSFDHRIIDGAVADRFMSKIKQTLEAWNA